MTTTPAHRKAQNYPPPLTCVNIRELLLCLVLLLLAACTADDSPTAPADDPLPPGLYPLQIASLTIAADGQPGTRLADNGNATSWQPGDQVMVSLGDRQAIYTYNAGTDTWQSDAPLYWQSKAPQTVNAWYPVAGEIDFTQQHIQGLTYLLKADPVSATYGQEEPVNLTFHHQLAKVRVVLEGAKAQEVAAVTVRSYPKSINDKGALGDRTGGDPIYVPLRPHAADHLRRATLLGGYLAQWHAASRRLV